MKMAVSMKSFAVAVALALAALVAGGYAVGRTGGQDAGGSVRQLVAVAGEGIDLDYTPLASPEDAVGKASLIVQGTLVRVADGIKVGYADSARSKRGADSYATFVISVDKVLSGSASQVTDGKVYVAVYKSTRASAAQLSKLNPNAKVVAVLDDISTWRPSRDASVTRPSAVPAGARLFAAYNDGLWLQGSADAQMQGVGVHATDLKPGWGGAKTVAQFADRAAKAAD